MVVATLDHAANAASVGQQLRPTTLVIGGNPRGRNAGDGRRADGRSGLAAEVLGVGRRSGHRPRRLQLRRVPRGSGGHRRRRPGARRIADWLGVGTPLIQASQTFGIDLPIRYLAWQDDDGVHVGHPDIRVLAQRHGAAGVEDTLTMIEGATDMFDAIAAGESP